MTGTLARRSFIGGAAATAGLFTVLGSQSPAIAADVLPGFPRGIQVRRRVYENWDGVVTTDALWTSVPRTADDVLAIVNWAHGAGYTVRAQGYAHSWSPLTVEPGTAPGAKTILMDTTSHLVRMSVPGPHRLRVEAGAEMTEVLHFLDRHGYAVAGAPAPGDVTVAGVLAVNGHGTGVLAAGETRQRGQTMGTLSNMVTRITAVVWDAASSRYVARTFGRDHADAAALLAHVGRSLILEVDLQVMPQYTLHSRSRTDVHIDTLFAAPERAGADSLTRLLDDAGRVGLIWYTYTEHPWIQIWKRADRRPLGARPTLGPFNYPFADRLPTPIPQILGRIISGQDWVAPEFGRAVLSATKLGLTATGARSMWGPSHDMIHFVRPTTLRVSAGSHAVVVRRADVQRVVHEFSTWFRGAIEESRKRFEFPVNSCVEIRVTGVDTPAEVDVPGAVAPALSAARPVDGRPELDTVVWLDALTLPGTPHEYPFFERMEAHIREAYGSYGVVRPEWAKRWATTAEGSWLDERVMRDEIPAAFPDWDRAMATYARHDPHRVFTSPLLDRLMPA